MSKFTFICEDEPMPFADSIVTKKTFEFNADHLDGVIGEFETFLKGCGYHIDGNLEIVEESKSLGQIYPRDGHEDDLDDIDSIFSGKKSLIRSDEC
jgi:hypothetical protein